MHSFLVVVCFLLNKTVLFWLSSFKLKWTSHLTAEQCLGLANSDPCSIIKGRC
jgi:hypothetical protein